MFPRSLYKDAEKVLLSTVFNSWLTGKGQLRNLLAESEIRDVHVVHTQRMKGDIYWGISG